MNYFDTARKKWLYLFLFLFCIFSGLWASAQNPVFKIDCDQSGRQDAEVLEPGYIGWTLSSSTRDTATLALSGGVTITLTRKGPYGDKISSNWYKAGVQAPYYARLVDDGFRINNGNAGAQMEMRISGLPAGRHSILTYHNNVDNASTGPFAPLDIYLNGELKYDKLVLSIRETVTSNVPVAYMYADVAPGQDVVVLFVADTTTGALIKNFMLNGIEINTPNPQYQARLPIPQNGDEHVDADNGTLNLKWTNAANAVASRVYFGSDSATVANATVTSPEYKGRVTVSNYTVRNQYSMNTYYWRIDQEDADTNITHGNVWYYRPRQLAFKDAEGYGRYARGGRGGKVVHVTNLNDAGPGSLREAVTNDIGPRTIVFDVSGIITLTSDRITIGSSYVTVAGQTAPGKGICIKGAPFGTGGKDNVIRHMRVRVGAGITYDGMGNVGDYSIIDNCSISWTIDEGFSSRNAKNITLQRTMIAEALNIAGHQNYPPGTAHGYAATISGNIGSFHHNLLAHCEGRNWSLGGGLDGNGYYAGYLDITNNVVYNWHNRTTDGGAHQVNFVNNYYKPGAASALFYAFTAQHEGTGLGTQQAYFAGNVMPGHFDESSEASGRRSVITNNEIVNYPTFVDTPFFPSYVQTQTAEDAFKRVLSNVGCNQPIVDSHDIRVIHETLTGTYTYKGSVSGLPGLPDNQADVGGWETYPQEQRDSLWDTDGDGLPNWFEKLKRLNPHSPAGDFSDANGDRDHDGFTNLDDYLEFMGGPHYFTRPFKPVAVDLAALTVGYTNSPTYTITKVVNGLVLPWRVVNGKVYFTTLGEGFGSFTFMVKDADGSTMTRTVNIVSSFDGSCPVEGIHFTGCRKDAVNVGLQWENENETPNGTYQVQRSFTAGGPFTTVATVQAKPTVAHSGQSISYETQDANNNTGISYYRLLQVTPDGKSTLSDVVTVNGIALTPSVKIWPIPANGHFNVLLTNIAQPVMVRIYRVDGTMVGTQQLVSPGVSTPFNITTPGTYVVKGLNKDTGEQVFLNKVVVE